MKICQGCDRSFVPQLVDQDIKDLFYGEEELERLEQMDEEHGHPHGPPLPFQELCPTCANDPDLVPVSSFPGGQVQWRRKPKGGDEKRKVPVTAVDEPPILRAGFGKWVDSEGREAPEEVQQMLADMVKGMVPAEMKVVKRGPKSSLEGPKGAPEQKPQAQAPKRPWWAFWRPRG